MKLALCLCIISMDFFSISTQNRNVSEGLDEILDKLIKQAEKGTDGVVVDKVEQKNNDSKVIYLKTIDSISRRYFERSTNNIKKLIQENADNYVSEEIIIEMKEDPNEGMGNDRDIVEKIAESDANIQPDDQNVNSDISGKNIKDDTVIEEMLLDDTINEENKNNIVEVLKDMFDKPSETLITNKHLNENKNHKPKHHDPGSKLSLRTLYPNADSGNLRSGFSENLRSPQKMLQMFPINYEMPFKDPVQSILTQQFLAEMVQSKVTQSPNYFQYYMPTQPPPSVVRTVIHQHSAFPPPVPYNWQSGGACCIS